MTLTRAPLGVITVDMATSGELIKTVAQITGHPEARVVTYFRSLREAGLVTKSGRGPSAAHMTPRDAATLLTALLGSRFDNEAAAKIARDFDSVVATHGAHRLADHGNAEDWVETQHCLVFEGFHIPALQGLAEHHTITDALAAVIEAQIADAFAKAVNQRWDNHGAYSIEIWFCGPQPSAAMEFNLSGDGCMYREDATYLPDTRLSDDEKPDFEIQRRITWRTIKAVANLIAGKAE